MAIDTSNSLLTLSQAKSYLSATSTGNDIRYEELINVVSHRFNSETGRLLKSRANTTYMDGNGKSSILVDQYPIVSVSTNIDIRVNPDRSYTTTYKISSTDIIIYSDEGRIVLDDDTFDVGEQSVKIVYTAGYTVASTSASSTEGTIPFDLKYAACEMLQLLWKREENRNRVGIRSESAEGASVTYETDMPWSVKQVLDRYRDKRCG